MLWAVYYDPRAKVLEAAFRNGGIFRYTGVPVAVYRELLRASSIGSYMRACIIGVYPEIQLE